MVICPCKLKEKPDTGLWGDRTHAAPLLLKNISIIDKVCCLLGRTVALTFQNLNQNMQPIVRGT